MASINEKLNYINETKSLIKNRLNDLGSEIEDETTFREYVEKIEDLYDEWPKISDEDTTINLENTKKGKMNLQLKGNINQFTTTGKNKLVSNLELLKQINSGGTWRDNTCTRNGITYTVNDDLSITIGGVYSERSFLYLMRPSTNIIFPSVVYRITGCPTGGGSDSYRLSFTYYDDNTYVSEVNEVGGGNKLDLSSVTTPKLQAIIEIKSASAIGKTFYPMIRLYDGTDSTYEPYTGGIASPNPDYPQDIHTTTGNNVIRNEGKNFFNIGQSTNTIYGITVKTNGSEITFNGSSTSNGYKINKTSLGTFKAGTHTFSFKRSGTINSTAGEEFTLLKDTTTIFTTSLNKDNYSYTFTLSEDAELFARYWIQNGCSYTNYIVDIQIEKGTSRSSYEPYTLDTYPLTLGTLEYNKIGNYEDEFIYNITDTNLELNKWYLKKNLPKYVFTGNETPNSITNGYYYYTNNLDTLKYVIGGFNTKFLFVNDDRIVDNETANTYLNENEMAFRLGNSKDRLYIKTQLSTGDLKSTLANTPLYYATANPEYLPLNDTLQTQLTNIYNNMMSKKDQTNINQINDDLPMVISATALMKNSD